MKHGFSEIQAVSFDAARTLLTVQPSVGHVYADQAALHGFKLHPDALNRSFTACWSIHRPRDGNGTPFHTSEAIEKDWWRMLVMDVFQRARVPQEFWSTFDSFFADLYERFAHPDVWHVYEDVGPALDGLRARGIRLAVVSNWDSRLPRLLAALGLADRFEFVLTSAEAGVSKPHPGIFREAAGRLALPLEAIVHIGDSEEEDVQGARDAGIRGILLNRTGAKSRRPDTIQALTDVLAATDF